MQVFCFLRKHLSFAMTAVSLFFFFFTESVKQFTCLEGDGKAGGLKAAMAPGRGVGALYDIERADFRSVKAFTL